MALKAIVSSNVNNQKKKRKKEKRGNRECLYFLTASTITKIATATATTP